MMFQGSSRSPRNNANGFSNDKDQEEHGTEPTKLQKLMERVADLRRRFYGLSCRVTGRDPIDVQHMQWNWFQILHHHFISEERLPNDDDLIFVVRKRKLGGSWVILSPKETTVEPIRRHSPTMPTPEDDEVDFEETVYLNLIMHYLDFTATVCVCSRTSLKDIQVLKRLSVKLFGATHKPNHLKGKDNSEIGSNDKSASAEISYPDIYFPVEEFDNIFSSFYIHDSESVCVELVARDAETGKPLGVMFQGSVRHEALQNALISRINNSGGQATQFGRRILGTRLAQLLQNVKEGEIIKMKGPAGKGLAEMIVSQHKSFSRPATPSIYSAEEESALGSHFESTKRRQSEVNGSGYYTASGVVSRRCTSDSGLKTDDLEEVVASRFQDEAADSGYDTSWRFRGINQAFHWFREKRRENSVALRTQLMCIKLPWDSMIRDLFDERTPPVLTLN